MSVTLILNRGPEKGESPKIDILLLKIAIFYDLMIFAPKTVPLIWFKLKLYMKMLGIKFYWLGLFVAMVTYYANVQIFGYFY